MQSSSNYHSVQQPRPYRPGQQPSLSSPQSYDSLQPPPSTTDSYTSNSLDGRDLQGGSGVRGRAGGGAGGGQQQQWAPPPPIQKHEAINLGGGTGVMGGGEVPAHRRKRIILMTLCGLIVCGIIGITVVGCKGLL